MAHINKNIIVAARNKVLQADPTIAQTIYDIRGERMCDKEVHEHVEKVIQNATRNAILEANDDDDDFDFDDADLDFDDFDLGDLGDEGDEGDKDPADLDDDFSDEDFHKEEAITCDDDDFEEATERIMRDTASAVADNSTSSAASRVISMVGHHFELSKVDYLDTIDALYKESVASGTHRDTYNLLTFIKFVDTSDLTAAFAFLDIPNTDLSEVFTLRPTSTYITVDGMFYKSTFNNDSILSWPWHDLKPSIDIFRDCPFDNLMINKVAGRKILQLPGIDSARESEIKSFSSKAMSTINAANRHYE